jgi:hypothetical protein
MKNEELENIKMEGAEVESILRELDEKDTSGIIFYKVQALQFGQTDTKFTDLQISQMKDKFVSYAESVNYMY